MEGGRERAWEICSKTSKYKIRWNQRHPIQCSDKQRKMIIILMVITIYDDNVYKTISRANCGIVKGVCASVQTVFCFSALKWIREKCSCVNEITRDIITIFMVKLCTSSVFMCVRECARVPMRPCSHLAFDIGAWHRQIEIRRNKDRHTKISPFRWNWYRNVSITLSKTFWYSVPHVFAWKFGNISNYVIFEYHSYAHKQTHIQKRNGCKEMKKRKTNST